MSFTDSRIGYDLLNDVDWLKTEFRRRFSSELNLSRPVTFNEKVQAYKLQYRDPLLPLLADKFAVRNYVAKTIGEQYLIPLIGCYESVGAVPIQELPDKFIIKATHGSGWNLLCMDKRTFDWDSEKVKLDEWLHTNFYLRFREWAYKDIPPRIVIEHLLQDENGRIPVDYKFFCFNGDPKLIQVDFDRHENHTRSLYDVNWKKLDVTFLYPDHPTPAPRPEDLDAMLSLAGKLSTGLPFVRVDLYKLPPKIYFGEMTFYPGAGFDKFDPPGWDELIGRNFDVSQFGHTRSDAEEPPLNAYDPFANDYDLTHLEQITTKRYGFQFFVTPRFKSHYSDLVYEETTALLIRQNAKGVGTFIDVGAHYGFFDVLVGLSNPHCKILAFEPIPENSEILRKNLAQNNVDASVYEFAVSDRPGRASFQVSVASDNSGFTANPSVDIARKIEINVVQLDQYLPDFPTGPVLIKIDTEGNEIRVLKGMQKLIEKCDDLRLVIECNKKCLEANGESPQTLLYYLNQLGFDVFFIQDEESRNLRYRPGSAWTDYMGGKTSCNLFCIKKSRSLSVVLFSHSSGLYGAERRMLELASELIADYGALCTVYVPDDGPLVERLGEIGVSMVLGRYHRWCWWPGNDPGPQPNKVEYEKLFTSSLEWLLHELPELKRLAPDVVLSSSIVIEWGAIAAALLNCPHVWLVNEFGELDHGLQFYLPFSQVINIIQSASNKIVTNSKSVQKKLFGEPGGENVETIYYHFGEVYSNSHGGDQKAFNFPKAVKLLLVGYVAPSKGQEDAVLAVIELVKQHRDVELVMVGSGQATYLEKLQRMVGNALLQDRVHFVPFRVNVRPLFSEADIIIVCSRNEAFGMVTAEGLLHGKAVIGTNTGGTPEIIDDGETGLLYEPGNIPQLVSQIKRLMDDLDLRNALGERGSRFARKTFTRDNFGGRYHDILLSLKSAKNPRSRQLQDLLNSLLISLFAGQDQALFQLSEVQRENDRLNTLLLSAQTTIIALRNSSSWRITTPWRVLGTLAHTVANAARKLVRNMG